MSYFLAFFAWKTLTKNGVPLNESPFKTLSSVLGDFHANQENDRKRPKKLRKTKMIEKGLKNWNDLNKQKGLKTVLEI